METQPTEFQLSEPERQALAVCGIYKAEQLAEVGLKALLRDIELASECFPEQMSALSEKRLKELFSAVTGTTGVTETPTNEEPKEPTDETGVNRELPKLIPLRHSSSKKKKKPTSKTHKELHDKSHCVHCTHPLRIYIGAWLTLLFYIDILAWLTIPALLLMGVLPEMNAKLVIAGLLLPALPFIFTCRKAKCSVCNIAIYPLRRYTHNRFAHNFLFFGTALSTALHVICFLWFRCPGCGTPQRLLRKKRNR